MIVVYFLWKRTPHGLVRVSCEGLGDFIRRFLAAKARLHSLALAEGENAPVTLVLSSPNESYEARIERRLSSLMEPMGMIISVVWSSRVGARMEWTEARASLCKSPWTWMALASSAALVVMAGWRKYFWTLFWGTVAWFIVKGLKSLFQGKKLFVSTGSGNAGRQG